MRFPILIGGLCLVGMVTGAQAGIWGSDKLLPWPDPAVPAQSRSVMHPVFKSVELGAFKIKFEKTTLPDIITAIGSGEIKHQGDAAASYYWICYRFNEAGGVGQLGIFVNAEMGGGAVTDVMFRTQKIEPDENCPFLPREFTPIITDTGLGLSSSYADFVKQLGTPGGQAQGKYSWIFDRESHSQGSPETWITEQWVDAEFHDGKLVAVLFGEETSD
jgi:hypothetical protein